MRLGGRSSRAFVLSLLGVAAACSSRGPLARDAGTPVDAKTSMDAAAGSAGGTSGGAGMAGGIDAAVDSSPGSDGDAAGGDGGILVQEIQWAASRDLDLLFMIDNSSSMAPLQNKLVSSFPVFMEALTSLPGGLPSLHIAVVSSDLGAGQFSEADIQGCRPGGDQGIFQVKPRGTTCATGALAAGQNFISNVGGVANYTGNIADVFGCIAALGTQGCGFEHQLASVLRALGVDGAVAPAANAGFLRPSAVLGIVLLTNEDDCSAPPNSVLFDPTSRLVSDQLGPLSSYRCNEFGHLCGGKAPPRMGTSPVDLSGTCTSNEDGPLIKVGDVVAGLKSLKHDPTQIIVSTIMAPPAPYIVSFTTPVVPDPSLWPTIEHSCVATDHSYGDPAVRLAMLTSAFGTRGATTSICADAFTHALDQIVDAVTATPAPPCLIGRLVDTSPTTPGLQASCTFVDHVVNAQGARVDTHVPSCAEDGNLPPCWKLATDASCGTGWLVELSRVGAQPTSLTTTATCDVCQSDDARAGCLSQ
jgi:hypothetical protein